MVAEVIAEERLNVKFQRLGLMAFAKGYGTHDDVKAGNSLGCEDIVSAVRGLLA